MDQTKLVCPNGLNLLRLQPGQRILIVAPHPDDEVLACAGLIQQALALGGKVWVVYVTAGDGSWPPAWRVTGNMLPDREDYLKLGRVRAAEAITGARTLGLDSTQLTFLGYPDANLAGLWQRNWYSPCRSSHTGAIADPYGGSGREYTGDRLLNDLLAALDAVKPDCLFGPHPLDAHADHWSTAMFIAIAREAWRRPATEPFPEVYGYLIHRPPYPDAQTDAAGFLSPPDDLTDANHHWFAHLLDDAQRQTKQRALDCHDSQRSVLGTDIQCYVAASELFDRLEVGAGRITEDAPQVGFMPAARLSLVEVDVRGESLNVKLRSEAGASSSFDYSFFAHSMEFEPDGVIHGGLAAELTSSPSAGPQGWSTRVPWNRGSGRSVLLYSAEVRWGTVLLNHSGLGRIAC
jgi:LmbE family N-acetylglucosaminyl deacetylase